MHIIRTFLAEKQRVESAAIMPLHSTLSTPLNKVQLAAFRGWPYGPGSSLGHTDTATQPAVSEHLAKQAKGERAWLVSRWSPMKTDPFEQRAYFSSIRIGCDALKSVWKTNVEMVRRCWWNRCILSSVLYVSLQWAAPIWRNICIYIHLCHQPLSFFTSYFELNVS